MLAKTPRITLKQSRSLSFCTSTVYLTPSREFSAMKSVPLRSLWWIWAMMFGLVTAEATTTQRVTDSWTRLCQSIGISRSKTWVNMISLRSMNSSSVRQESKSSHISVTHKVPPKCSVLRVLCPNSLPKDRIYLSQLHLSQLWTNVDVKLFRSALTVTPLLMLVLLCLSSSCKTHCTIERIFSTVRWEQS